MNCKIENPNQIKSTHQQIELYRHDFLIQNTTVLHDSDVKSGGVIDVTLERDSSLCLRQAGRQAGMYTVWLEKSKKKYSCSTINHTWKSRESKREEQLKKKQQSLKSYRTNSKRTTATTACEPDNDNLISVFRQIFKDKPNR
ncbi:hypothetical protein T06_6106 [Trichinella sp. T6]|nr:hypothetical protein T06_6106 [Trichinella sp. T6]